MTRKEQVLRAAQTAADNAAKSIPESTTITVKNPFINSALSNGERINVFDFTDGRQRVMFLIETFPKEQSEPGKENAIHALRWNCDPFQAHTLAVDGNTTTRTAELQAIDEMRAAMEKQAAVSQEEGN